MSRTASARHLEVSLAPPTTDAPQMEDCACGEPVADHPRGEPCHSNTCNVCGDIIHDDRMTCELCRYVDPYLMETL